MPLAREVVAGAFAGLGLLVLLANLNYWLSNLRGHRMSPLPPVDVLFAIVAAAMWRSAWPEERWPIVGALLVTLAELPLLIGLARATWEAVRPRRS